MKEILITSSVLIGVILLLRLFLGKRVSRRLIYAAWLLVALRLLIPFQFGQSDYSMITVADELGQHSKLVQQAEKAFRQPVDGPSQEEVYQQLVAEYLTQPSLPSSVVMPEVQKQLWQEAEEITTASTDFSQLLSVIWISGMVLTAGWFLITNLVFLRKNWKGSVPCHQSSGKIPVRISSTVSTPCLTGLFRPVIFLTPESISDPQGLNHVLTHELTHYRHGDHIWAWIRCLCLCIYWFDPLVWIAAILSKRDCELACDEAALKQLGEDQRIPYGRTLLATVTHASVRIFHTTTAMSESRKQLKERVNFIVKKPRNILIAAIVMVLVTAIVAGCAFTGSNQPDASRPDPIENPTTEQTKPTDTTPEQTDPTTEPSHSQQEPAPVPTAPYDVLQNTPDVLTEPTTESLQIAQDAIHRYLQYRITGICCDNELVIADLSQYLTDAQKEEYYGQERKITCCQNPQQVRAHIDRYLSKDLRRFGYPDEKLFKDGDDNLYVAILPSGYDGYQHITVISQTNGEIVARACRYDEDGCYTSDIFTLQSTDQGYQITKVEEDKDYRCEPMIVDQGTKHKVLKYGIYYNYEIYGDDGELRIRQTTDLHCPSLTRLSDDIWEVAVGYGTGITQRTYWYMKNLRSEIYNYVIAVGYGKIAYLDGDLNNRVLVVCDIFDRSNAQTYEDFGFAAEPMPISEAFFTEDEYGYTLTFTYHIGKTTEATASVAVLP